MPIALPSAANTGPPELPASSRQSTRKDCTSGWLAVPAIALIGSSIGVISATTLSPCATDGDAAAAFAKASAFANATADRSAPEVEQPGAIGCRAAMVSGLIQMMVTP